MRAGALIAALLLCAAPAVAQDAAPSELLLVHGDGDPERDARAAARILMTNGAGRYELDQLTAWDVLLDDGGWLGPAPREACPDGGTARAAASLAAELDNALVPIQFGRNAVAIDALRSIAAALPCAGEPLDDALLARLWFLLGAVHYLDGRAAESRAAFERAALVDFAVAFDELFPDTVYDALLAAKNAVLSRSLAWVVVLGNDVEVRIDGRLVPMKDGVGSATVRVGPRLVQMSSGGRTESRRVVLDAVPMREGIAALAIVSRHGLDAGLRAVEGGGEAGAATAAVLGALAERGVPWGVLIAARGDRTRHDRALTRLDAVTAQAGVYTVKTDQADVFGRRARVAGGLVYRGQGRTNEQPLHYGGGELAFWVPIHWLLRAGLSAQWALTPRPAPEGSTVCCSTFELAPRLRAELSRGTFRPLGEVGLILFWPAGNLEGERVGIRDVTLGFDVGGGVLVTPERTRRFGLSATGFFGGLGGIGFHVRVRVAAELRF